MSDVSANSLNTKCQVYHHFDNCYSWTHEQYISYHFTVVCFQGKFLPHLLPDVIVSNVDVMWSNLVFPLAHLNILISAEFTYFCLLHNSTSTTVLHRWSDNHFEGLTIPRASSDHKLPRTPIATKTVYKCVYPRMLNHNN